MIRLDRALIVRGRDEESSGISLGESQEDESLFDDDLTQIKCHLSLVDALLATASKLKTSVNESAAERAELRDTVRSALCEKRLAEKKCEASAKDVEAGLRVQQDLTKRLEDQRNFRIEERKKTDRQKARVEQLIMKNRNLQEATNVALRACENSNCDCDCLRAALEDAELRVREARQRAAIAEESLLTDDFQEEEITNLKQQLSEEKMIVDELTSQRKTLDEERQRDEHNKRQLNQALRSLQDDLDAERRDRFLEVSQLHKDLERLREHVKHLLDKAPEKKTPLNDHLFLKDLEHMQQIYEAKLQTKYRDESRIVVHTNQNQGGNKKKAPAHVLDNKEEEEERMFFEPRRPTSKPKFKVQLPPHLVAPRW